MSVDQRGEDILFVQDGPEFEVHIRIEYEGDAEHFAWLLPLHAVPQVSVGSEPLFVQLAQASAPRWTRSHAYQCPDEDPSQGATSIGFVPADDWGGAADPEIVLQTTVGAFEVVVLQGGTAAEVIEFLDQKRLRPKPRGRADPAGVPRRGLLVRRRQAERRRQRGRDPSAGVSLPGTVSG